jgi:hypothetical protein
VWIDGKNTPHTRGRVGGVWIDACAGTTCTVCWCTRAAPRTAATTTASCGRRRACGTSWTTAPCTRWVDDEGRGRRWIHFMNSPVESQGYVAKKFDAASIDRTQVKESSVLSQKAYMLFYLRTPGSGGGAADAGGPPKPASPLSRAAQAQVCSPSPRAASTPASTWVPIESTSSRSSPVSSIATSRTRAAATPEVGPSSKAHGQKAKAKAKAAHEAKAVAEVEAAAAAAASASASNGCKRRQSDADGKVEAAPRSKAAKAAKAKEEAPAPPSLKESPALSVRMLSDDDKTDSPRSRKGRLAGQMLLRSQKLLRFVPSPPHIPIHRVKVRVLNAPRFCEPGLGEDRTLLVARRSPQKRHARRRRA